MKSLGENIKLAILEGCSIISGILALIFVFVPAYFEDGRADMTTFQIMLGDDRLEGSPLIVLGFVCLILGIVASGVLLALLLLKKSNPLTTTLISIGSIVLTLIGGVILTCSIFIVGLDTLNSELGLVQGSWGFRAGFFLIPIFSLISIGLSYPSAMIILHHQDLRDAGKLESQAN